MCEDARTATKENHMPSYRDMLALPHDPLIGEALRDESLRRARAEYAEACRKLRRDPALTAFEMGDHTPRAPAGERLVMFQSHDGGKTFGTVTVNVSLRSDAFGDLSDFVKTNLERAFTRRFIDTTKAKP